MKNLFFTTICILTLAGCSSTPKQAAEPVVESGAPVEEAPSYTDTQLPSAPATAKEDVKPVPTVPLSVSTAEQVQSKLKELYKAVKAKNESEINQKSADVLMMDPENISALNALGVYYYSQGRFDMARLFLQRALKKSNSSSLHANLANILIAEGEENDAILELRSALKLDPRNAAAAASLGSIHSKYKNYGLALPLLEQAYQAKVADLRVGNNYAVSLWQTGKKEEADKIFDKLTSTYQTEVGLLLNYALFLYDFKDSDKSMKMINKIRFLSTENAILAQANQLANKIEIDKKGGATK